MRSNYNKKSKTTFCDIQCLILSIIFSAVSLSLVGVYFYISDVKYTNNNSSNEVQNNLRGDFINNLGPDNFDPSNGYEKDNNIMWPTILSAVPTDNSYPVYDSLLNIVTNWGPDDPEIPATFKESLQHFNYSNPIERDIAFKFRDAEIPFKVYNVPEFEAAKLKWNDEYLSSQLRGRFSSHVEESTSNHFMFWKSKGSIKGYKPPTSIVQMSFDEWVKKAHHADDTKLSSDSIHHYFMTNAPPRDNGRTFVSRDLPSFSSDESNFFLKSPKANKGIQCRFGMRGIIAEAHYDSGRNMVAMLKGTKRYILAPPKACSMLGIIDDVNHPSYRHSIIDWSDINQAKSHNFDKIDAIDTIVRTGEVLYIPSYWFHYIISLEYSIQCNTRAGSPEHNEGQKEIENCLKRKFGNLDKYNGKA